MPDAAEVLTIRDTDADWRELGVRNPYWGVISHPRFLRENLTPEGLEDFYLSGQQHIEAVAKDLGWLTGKPPSGRALDFGCGVGRLAEAMTRFAGEVTGYDISPGMLELARARGRDDIRYVGELPDGPFDWINSFIVFQHIPPERGLELIRQLMARLAAGGVISLHLTVWREPALEQPQAQGLRRLLQGPRLRRWVLGLPVGQILMYDYDLSRVLRILNEGGVEDVRLVSTDHGGHHGVIILGRKGQPANTD